jgi:hypothetical protein
LENPEEEIQIPIDRLLDKISSKRFEFVYLGGIFDGYTIGFPLRIGS